MQPTFAKELSAPGKLRVVTECCGTNWYFKIEAVLRLVFHFQGLHVPILGFVADDLNPRYSILRTVPISVTLVVVHAHTSLYG